MGKHYCLTTCTACWVLCLYFRAPWEDGSVCTVWGLMIYEPIKLFHPSKVFLDGWWNSEPLMLRHSLHSALCKVLVVSEMWVWGYNNSDLILGEKQDDICCPFLAQTVRSSSISKHYSHSGCVYARFTLTSSNWPDTSVSTNRSMNSRTWAESGFIATPFSQAATQSKVLEPTYLRSDSII
jgi:hypothetical protein